MIFKRNNNLIKFVYVDNNIFTFYSFDFCNSVILYKYSNLCIFSLELINNKNFKFLYLNKYKNLNNLYLLEYDINYFYIILKSKLNLKFNNLSYFYFIDLYIYNYFNYIYKLHFLSFFYKYSYYLYLKNNEYKLNYKLLINNLIYVYYSFLKFSYLKNFLYYNLNLIYSKNLFLFFKSLQYNFYFLNYDNFFNLYFYIKPYFNYLNLYFFYKKNYNNYVFLYKRLYFKLYYNIFYFKYVLNYNILYKFYNLKFKNFFNFQLDLNLYNMLKFKNTFYFIKNYFFYNQFLKNFKIFKKYVFNINNIIEKIRKFNINFIYLNIEKNINNNLYFFQNKLLFIINNLKKIRKKNFFYYFYKMKFEKYFIPVLNGIYGFYYKHGKISYKNINKFFFSLKKYSKKDSFFIFTCILDAFVPTLKAVKVSLRGIKGKKKKVSGGAKGKKNKTNISNRFSKYILKNTSLKNKKFLTYLWLLKSLKGKSNIHGVSGLLFAYNILYLFKFNKGLSLKTKFDYYKKTIGNIYFPNRKKNKNLYYALKKWALSRSFQYNFMNSNFFFKKDYIKKINSFLLYKKEFINLISKKLNKYSLNYNFIIKNKNYNLHLFNFLFLLKQEYYEDNKNLFLKFYYNSSFLKYNKNSFMRFSKLYNLEKFKNAQLYNNYFYVLEYLFLKMDMNRSFFNFFNFSKYLQMFTLKIDINKMIHFLRYNLNLRKEFFFRRSLYKIHGLFLELRKKNKLNFIIFLKKFKNNCLKVILDFSYMRYNLKFIILSKEFKVLIKNLNILYLLIFTKKINIKLNFLTILLRFIFLFYNVLVFLQQHGKITFDLHYFKFYLLYLYLTKMKNKNKFFKKSKRKRKQFRNKKKINYLITQSYYTNTLNKDYLINFDIQKNDENKLNYILSNFYEKTDLLEKKEKFLLKQRKKIFLLYNDYIFSKKYKLQNYLELKNKLYSELKLYYKIKLND